MPREASAQTADWQHLLDRLAALGERRLVLIEGDRDAALDWLGRLLPSLSSRPGLWVGSPEASPDPDLATVAPGKARSWLGRELGLVVWDGWHGNPPDGLAAIAGTMTAGGLLFWLMPPLSQWSAWPDPDYARTGLDSARYHAFADRMATILGADPAVIRVNAATPEQVRLPSLAVAERPFSVGTNADQQQLVDQLVTFGLGRRRRPVVVTADRGRGKSAALGMAAARLLQQGRQRVLVTAPSRESVATLFRHARETLGDELAAEDDGRLLCVNGGELNFLPVQALLAERPDAEVVLVDEAAAIPPHTLKRILTGWPRVAFCSTVHGYEGAGRGFNIRFRAILESETPRWQGLTLREPIRWAAGDPLEPLIDRLFLLSASGFTGDLTDPEIGVERWQPAGATEAERNEAFGLLVDAHYRTTPADLRQWLDDPAAVSWVARCQGHIVGVLWAAREGGLPEDLGAQIALGERRVRGHLLPQSLASHAGFPEAACQRTLRVIRIAVRNDLRHGGVGRRLVLAARNYAVSEELDTLGSSFGGTPELLAFWRACDLAFVRLGFQQEATSGEYPFQVLSGVSVSGIDLVSRLRSRLARYWTAYLAGHWRDLSPELVMALTRALPATGRLDGDDHRDLFHFARGHRGFDLCLPVLQVLSQCPGVIEWLERSEDALLWAESVLQQRSWPELQVSGRCLGQRDGEDRLRSMVRELLQNGPEL